MKKAVSKRFKLTKKGKLVRRKMAQGHFRANKSRKAIRNKRASAKIHKAEHKTIKNYFSRGGSR